MFCVGLKTTTNKCG